jgi:metal iron transporter
MVVAIAVGRSGIDALLVASQVVLSIVLPFITFPLIYCTSSKAIMSVRKSRSPGDAVPSTDASTLESAGDEMVDFSSGKIATAIGGAICLVVIAANVYVIVSLALGNEG